MTGVTDPLNGTASYEYDLLGRMIGATNPNGHSTTYAYDSLGKLTREIDPLGNATTYAYDPNGNLESRGDAMGRTTRYSYDVLDRLTETDHPDDSGITRTYNAVGELTSITDKTGTTGYAYDERDRLVKETLPGNKVLEYAYDASGNRTSLTYPGGEETLFEYDEAERLTSVTGPEGQETSYAYDDQGLPTRISHPNEVAESYTYDPLGRMTEAVATNGTSTLSSLSYVYDKNSNPTSITDKANARSTFTYDALDRLLEEEHPESNVSYAYDAAGNRTSMTRTGAPDAAASADKAGADERGASDKKKKKKKKACSDRKDNDGDGKTDFPADPGCSSTGDEDEADPPPTTTTVEYAYDDAERMTQAGQTTFSYDENGNMISRASDGATTNYAYDFEDQLVRAGTKTYTRDAFGRAVSSKDGATTTDYLFDGEEVIREKAGTADQITYTRGLEEQLVSRKAGAAAPAYYHHDAIGSVVALSDSAGKPADAYSYTAFGNVREHTGTSEQPFTYVGNAYDPKSKLMDFHARAYDTTTGRFTSTDPVAGLASMPQSLNPYVYGYGNPLAYPDPNGKCPICVPFAVAGIGYLAKNAAQSGAISAGEHYLTHRNDKGGIDLGDFGRTVLGDALTGSVDPLGGLGKVGKVRKFANGGKPKLPPAASGNIKRYNIDTILSNPNNRGHFFAPKHNLDRLGTDSQALDKVAKSVFEADKQGLVPKGRKFDIIRNIDGHSVTVTGRIVNGELKLSNAWIP